MANWNGDLGPCQILWNSVDLGYTADGVIVRHAKEGVDIKVDQEGTMAVDHIETGSVLEVETSLTRASLAKFNTILAPRSGAYTSGGSGGPSLTLYNDVGRSYYDLAQTLVLKPYINGIVSTDQGKWRTFFKTFPQPNFEENFDNENQRVYKVMFKIFPVQEVGSDYRKLGKMGK